MDPFITEAEVFGRYLLGGKNPNAKSISLYVSAMNIRPANAIGRDVKILNFILKNPRTIGMIDGALAFSPKGVLGTKKKSIVRRKILFMSAILETQPEYADLFLPQERDWTYNIYIFWVGFRAVSKAIAGKIILAFF
ncbi:MAG TPA: hypothetical protein VFJ43_16920 [Bacteroidia bacterium]|nr:hypothetical protein [Bacteroidia bacterium]